MKVDMIPLRAVEQAINETVKQELFGLGQSVTQALFGLDEDTNERAVLTAVAMSIMDRIENNRVVVKMIKDEDGRDALDIQSEEGPRGV